MLNNVMFYLLVLFLIAQLCPRLCDPMDWVRQAPLSSEILQARTLEWVAMLSSRDQTQVSHNAGGFFYCLSHQESPRNLKM